MKHFGKPLEAFACNASDDDLIARDFQLRMSGVALEALNPSDVSRLPKGGGCYLWVLKSGTQRFKIYAGRTNSLRRRVADYRNAIQIFSSNDYKLRFFQAWSRAVLPDSSLDLYFQPIPESRRSARERELIRVLRPFMNPLRPPNEAERARILAGFQLYYEAAFTDRDAAG